MKKKKEVRVMEIELDGAPLHLFSTENGNMFVMSEVAVELFKDNPGAFGKELRVGRYPRIHVMDKAVMRKIEQYHIPPESATVVGATLIPPSTLEDILSNRRRDDLVSSLKISLLQIVVQEAAKLLEHGLFEDALPFAIDAVHQGQILFYPKFPNQLVPIYLIAIQANLGLGRTMQSEDLLGLAAWLLLQDRSGESQNKLRAELSRLYGQLYALQGKIEHALKAFAEEVYHDALDYGIDDTHTTIGLFHLSRVFKSMRRNEDSMAYDNRIIYIWLQRLERVIFEEERKHASALSGVNVQEARAMIKVKDA